MTQPEEKVISLLAQALAQAGITALTEEQAQEVVRTAQAIEQMRLARLAALASLEQLGKDFDKLLAETSVSDKTREVLEFFVELEMTSYADQLRQALKQQDEQIRRELLTPSVVPHVVKDVTPPKPIEYRNLLRRIVQLFLGIGSIVGCLVLWVLVSPSGGINWAAPFCFAPFVLLALYIAARLEE